MRVINIRLCSTLLCTCSMGALVLMCAAKRLSVLLELVHCTLIEHLYLEI